LFRNAATGAQWDLKVYYYAALAFGQGLNPYSMEALKAVSEGAVTLPYTYPPLTLIFFVPLTFLSLKTALKLWFVLKVCAAFLTAHLWMKWLDIRFGLPVVCTILFGFNLAILHDLVSGNISLFEQLTIIFALTSLIRGKVFLFGAALVLSAQFRLLPIAFSGLPLLFYGWKGMRTSAIIVLAWGSLLLVNFLAFPDMSAGLIASLSTLDERGEINPSTLSFLRDLVELGLGKGTYIAEILYLALTAIVGVLAIQKTALLRRMDITTASLLLITAYGLAMPRFKDYTFVLVLPALAAVLFTPGRLVWRISIGVIALLPNLAVLLSLKGPARLAFDYQPWFAMILLFAFLMTQKSAGQKHNVIRL